MKNYAVIGFVLIALGICALGYQAITYTTREKTLDVGPIHVTTEKNHTIPLPPILGAVAIAGGVVALFVGSKRSA